MFCPMTDRKQDTSRPCSTRFQTASMTACESLPTALSRVRNFSDLSVDRPIKYADIIVDSMVMDFLTRTFPDNFDFAAGGKIISPVGES